MQPIASVSSSFSQRIFFFSFFRNRIARLIEPFPAGDPVRREGERQIARLQTLSDHSGEPRHGLGIEH